MKRSLLILCSALALLAIAATIPTSSLVTRDVRINNTTDTVGLTIQKGSLTGNFLEAFEGSNLRFAIPSSGVLGVEYGGVGAALTDPGADRILFWDDSATNTAYLTAGTALGITGTTLAVTTVPVANGGTGATTATAARAAIGLGEHLTNSVSALAGVIGVQAGSVTTAEDGTVTNTFAAVFASAPVVVISQVGDAVTVTNNLVSVTESNFVFASGSEAAVAKWIAVGAP